MQSLQDFEAGEEERQFMKAVVSGLNDLESGQTVFVGRSPQNA